MTSRYGRIDLPWGVAHFIERGNRRYPVGGSPPGTETLHRTWAEETEEGGLRVTGGSSFTCVVELSDPPRAWTLLPYGNSEDPRSPHFADQAALQSTGRLKPARFADEEVRADAASVVTVPLDEAERNRAALRARWRKRVEHGPARSGADGNRTEPP